MSRLWTPRASPRCNHKFHRWGELFTERKQGTPVVAAANASINFTGGGVFLTWDETYGTPLLANAAASINVYGYSFSRLRKHGTPASINFTRGSFSRQTRTDQGVTTFRKFWVRLAQWEKNGAPMGPTQPGSLYSKRGDISSTSQRPIITKCDHDAWIHVPSKRVRRDFRKFSI